MTMVPEDHFQQFWEINQDLNEIKCDLELLKTNYQQSNHKIYYQKIKENAIIPSKKETDGGYDIYSCFKERWKVIEPHTVELIPTGIATSFDRNLVALLRERGSTGTLGMTIRAGVIDSSYRGEWFVAIGNITNKMIFITKNIDEVAETNNIIYYPYKKAIAQFILTNAYHCESEVVDDINKFKSIRGEGKLGSSNK